MAIDKNAHGYIPTPAWLADRMLDAIPLSKFIKPACLDPGAGDGNLTARLLERVPNCTVDAVDIDSVLIGRMRKRFAGETRVNIREEDVMSMSNSMYDLIICNPPYNSGGAVKTPTNTKVFKYNDGKIVWRAFVRRVITQLRPNGFAVFLVPSIWMRGQRYGGDRDGMYTFFRSFGIRSIQCMSNTETNSAFGNSAQTPTCIVAIGLGTSTSLDLHALPSHWLDEEIPMPTSGMAVAIHLERYVRALGSVPVSKGRFVPASAKGWLCVNTCVLERTKRAVIRYQHSEKRTHFADGRSKLILAHKMYGLPIVDASGTLGVTSGDNFVVYVEPENIELMRRYLSSSLALYVYDSFRYRMRFLEREAFAMLPDIRNIVVEPTNEGFMNALNLPEILRIEIRHCAAMRSFDPSLEPIKSYK